MANPNPEPKQAKHGKELVQRTRAGILNAFDVVEKRGDKKLISEYLADAFIDNPLKFMDTAAKYLPKEVNIDMTHSQAADKLTDEELADIIAQRARAKFEQAKDVTDESELQVVNE